MIDEKGKRVDRNKGVDPNAIPPHMLAGTLSAAQKPVYGRASKSGGKSARKSASKGGRKRSSTTGTAKRVRGARKSSAAKHTAKDTPSESAAE